jgi:hypothetical protein
MGQSSRGYVGVSFNESIRGRLGKFLDRPIRSDTRFSIKKPILIHLLKGIIIKITDSLSYLRSMDSSIKISKSINIYALQYLRTD